MLKNIFTLLLGEIEMLKKIHRFVFENVFDIVLAYIPTIFFALLLLVFISMFTLRCQVSRMENKIEKIESEDMKSFLQSVKRLEKENKEEYYRKGYNDGVKDIMSLNLYVKKINIEDFETVKNYRFKNIK